MKHLRERDQVVETLPVAAGDGRLIAAGLDERLHACTPRSPPGTGRAG